MDWKDALRAAVTLTSNPATAALFQLLGIAVQAVGVDTSGANQIIDAGQKAANQLVDAIQRGIMPDIRLDEPRHEAALNLVIDGEEPPKDLARVEPATEAVV